MSIEYFWVYHNSFNKINPQNPSWIDCMNEDFNFYSIHREIFDNLDKELKESFMKCNMGLFNH